VVELSAWWSWIPVFAAQFARLACAAVPSLLFTSLVYPTLLHRLQTLTVVHTRVVLGLSQCVDPQA